MPISQLIPGRLADGLSMMPKGLEIDSNEAGMIDGTIKFYCLNDQYKNFAPAQGTKVKDFRFADDGRTAAALQDIDWLAAQTHRFTRNGHVPGVGVLEVAVKGAIFTEFGVDASDPITKPFISFETTPETMQFVSYGGASSGTTTIRRNASVATLDALIANYNDGSEEATSPLFPFPIPYLESVTPSVFFVIDGIPLDVGKTVLVKNQAFAAQNGIYTLVNRGSRTQKWKLKRIQAMSIGTQIDDNIYVQIAAGTVNKGTSWHCTTAGPITMGSDAINFVAA